MRYLITGLPKMSAEQKLAAVERYLTSRESSRTVAADFGISHRYLLTLTNQYQKNGVEAFVRTIYKLHKSI